MQASSGQLSKLVSNLDVAQHDLWLKENGDEPFLFLDTADVRRALLGASEFIEWAKDESMEVDVEEFNKPQVLVDCLVSARFLGSFSMLPPHQAELLRQLKNDEAFVRAPRKVDQTKFLKRVGIDSQWGTGITGSANDQALKETLRNHAGAKTEKFFKAIQCIRMPWWDQLRTLTAQRIFVQDSTRFDYAALLKRPELPQLLNAFKESRPESHDHAVNKNNFADAVSLLMIMELVGRFRRGDSKIVPRFFDSTGLFTRVANLSGVEADLLIVSDGFQTSALVDAKGLTYAASLGSRKDATAFLEKLKEAVAGTQQEAEETHRLDSLVREVIGPLGNQVRQVLDLSFLENIWLKTAALDELQEITNRWVAESALTEKFRDVVDQTVAASVKGVLSGAAEYRFVSTTWIGLRHELLHWRKKQLEQRARSPEFDLDLKLFRFSPPEDMIESVHGILQYFVDDQLEDHQVTGLSAWHRLLACCVSLERHEPRKAEENVQKAELVAGALWAIDAHLKLVEILKTHVASGSSFVVEIIYLAAMLRVGRDLWKVEKGVEELCDELMAYKASAPDDEESKGELLVRSSSVAFIWFHLWRAKVVRPTHWRLGPAAQAQLQATSDKTSKSLQRAIEYVELAYQYSQSITSSDDHWRGRKIFVANQRLYYLVEEGFERRVKDLDDAYDELEGYRESAKALWQPTYSDTLARYWAFMAYRVNDAKNWAGFIDLAREHFKLAASAEESEVGSFGAYLKRTEAAGFQPRESPSSSGEGVTPA